MNTPTHIRHARHGSIWILLFLLLGLLAHRAGAAVVYSEVNEFLSAGDFNGDGVLDVMVLDKATGNARIGYQTNSVLTWSAPCSTSLAGVEAAGVGKFRDSNADSIAVAAGYINRVLFVRGIGNTSSPAILTPLGLGPNLLAGLSAPYGTNGTWDTLIIGSQANNTNFGLTLLENWGFTGDVQGVNRDSVPQAADIELANPLTLDLPSTFLAAMQRDTNDTFLILSPSNHMALVASVTGLLSGTKYAYGPFNGESLPHFFFYVPGHSNLLINTLTFSNGSYVFDSGVSFALPEAVDSVYYVDRGSDGVALIKFGDGVAGLTLPGGNPVLSSTYRSGAGSSGNAFTGVVPLGNGSFALLDGPPGAASSSHDQVVRFDGNNFTQLSSANLPSPTTRATRADVWLFQTEPFVRENVLLIASSNAPDWSSSATITSGILSVSTETDAGPASGLGNVVSNNFGAVPLAAAFALPDQYGDAISLFTYSAPQAPEPMNFSISPVPGLYGAQIKVSFGLISGSPKVHYRLSSSQNYQLYTGAFFLTNDTTVQYYATNTTSRSRLYAATYTFGRAGHPGPQPVLDVAPGTTNPAPPIRTNAVILSDIGTVFYGRRKVTATSAGFYGPNSYLSFADSPYAQSNAFNYFYIENFEHGSINLPGAGMTPGWVIADPSPTTDSVDADDGAIDGSGAGGHSLYSNGQNSLTISFSAAALGGHLPTHVGIVWTDVGTVSSGIYGFGTVNFTAIDQNGASLGTITGPNLGDGLPFAGTSEDRFFGAVNRGGISSFTLSMPASTDWEVDHIQYGYLPPEGFDGTVWAVSLDGSGDTLVTTGARPRVSKDGRWLAFLREGDPFNNRGNIWVRDLVTGYENRLVVNTGNIIGYDWDLSNTNLIFDYNGGLWSVGLTGSPVALPTPQISPSGAPAVDPISGRMVYMRLFPAAPGLFLTDSQGNLLQPLNTGAVSPMWANWAADGRDLVFSDNPIMSGSTDAGQSLWTADSNGIQSHQITGSPGLNYFPHGALFSPGGEAIVGAGTVFGTNGLWMIFLTPDRDDCDGLPVLITSSLKETIDYAGTIITSPAPATVTEPALFIVLQNDAAVVYWSAAYQGFTLEFNQDLGDASGWTAIPGPYAFDGYFFRHQEPIGSLAQQKFFRLHGTAPR